MSFGDITLFIAVPILSGAVAYVENLTFSKDVYNVSVTFYGIFIALVLNIQVAVFAIFQRKRERSGDHRMAEIQDDEAKLKRQLLSELNSNLSYLTLFSCVALSLFMILYMAESATSTWASVSVIIYTHFMLTLLMVVKRSHAIFQQEYSGNG